MGKKHLVSFEPVDLQMEVDEEETVLNAAFRQGIALMHGCKEGQCSACKSFLLDGDVQMDRYSTFALADYESDEGYVLLCKSHAFSDLRIELINYDEDMLRDAVPIQQGRARVEAVTPLTHDIVSLTLGMVDPPALTFKAGQYVDITVPGSTQHRSFSIATTPDTPERLEFIIKRYPGGLFSGLLDGHLRPGDTLDLVGPYGTFTLRAKSDRRVVFIGGGAGMAPILGLLRQMVREGLDRPVTFYYGARTVDDLFYRDEIDALGGRLAHFAFIPCLSDAWPDDWTTRPDGGRTGIVTTVVDAAEADLDDADVYLCGPPPMVDAALELTDRRGVPREQVHYDKFTTAVGD